MNIKTNFLAIVISVFMIISVPVAAQETDHANVIAAEISAIMASGQSLEQAVDAVVEKYARELDQFPDILVSIYTAIAKAANQNGISANSTQFSAAIGAALEIMIVTLGIPEETVVTAALEANINTDVVLVALSAVTTVVAVDDTVTDSEPELQLVSIISNSSSSGGSAASP